MTIHNLTPEANILFASESIVDVLGYEPHEVAGRSCFDYFHPDEVPFARGAHNREVKMDKAAVLYYARIQDRNGQWIGCECVFSVVYDVLVACTSIYRGGLTNERRAVEAPAVRRRFASSPRDPRYHMLEHLSAKFRAPPQHALREPRAALILNRFTRTLTVMYATNAVANILGVSADQLTGKSFYECIQESCLPDAIRCLESAKANDSIAYLRFWYRDPRRPEDLVADEETAMAGASQSSDSEDGGVELHGHSPMDIDSNQVGEGRSNAVVQDSSPSQQSIANTSGQNTSGDEQLVRQANSRTDSGESTDGSNHPAIFDHRQGSRSSSSSLMATPEQRRQARAARTVARRLAASTPTPAQEEYEIEAVVSCTSDGLVVILRRARPEIPDFKAPAPVHRANGIFAAPWGAQPVRPHFYQPDPQHPFQHGLDAPLVPVGGPSQDDFMLAIRDVAVFAWSLVGINGNIASYSHGVPRGEAVPPNGLPLWDPYGQPAPAYTPPENQALASWAARDAKNAAEMRLENGYAEDAMTGIARRHAEQGPYVYQGPESWTRNGYEMQFQVSAPSNNGDHTPTTTAGEGWGGAYRY